MGAPHPGSSTGEAVAALLQGSVDRIAGNLPLVGVGADPEALHQVRVGIRRLRSDLRTLRPLLDDRQVDLVGLQTDLRELFVALGRSRDLDVLAERLRDDPLVVPGDLAVTGDGVPAVAWARLLAAVEAERDDVAEEAGQVLASDWAKEVLGRAASLAAGPPVKPDVAARPARPRLRSLARHECRALVRAARRAGPDPSAAALHRVRRRAKRARYATEAAASVDGKGLRRAVRAIERVQDHLGAHQDLVVAPDRLAEVAAADPAVAFLAGRVAQRDAERAEAMRRRWPEVWRGVARDLRAVTG